MIALLAGATVACTILALAGRAPSARRPGRTELPSRPLTLSDVVAAFVELLDRGGSQPGAGHGVTRSSPDALDRLASSMRGGRSVGPAIQALAAGLADPLGTEMRALSASLRHGAPVAAALARWASAPDSSPDVRLVAAALTLGADAGGEVARAVDRIAATLRERRELQTEVRALATQARASAGVLAVAPLAFTALVATIEPKAVTFLVTSPIGWACLLAGLGLEAIGARWMARITRAAA